MRLVSRRPERPAGPPPFTRIGIVGLGLIGGSVALASRHAWPASLVIGVDRNEVLEGAIRSHAIDVGADEPGILAEADLVVLAAPVRANREWLARIGDAVTGRAIVTDVGSTKRAMVDAASVLPERFAFVGGHPLAGAARAGIEHARDDLFEDRPWLLTPTAATPADAIERVEAFIRGLGATPHRMSPDAHDAVVASLSHLPQLAATCLMAAVGSRVGDDGLRLAGRGLLDTTRLSSSPASVWTDICATNADYIAQALDDLIERLTRLRETLADPGEVAGAFDEANAWRARLLELAAGRR